eukprot:COSAG02_NODE_5209_length_4540_cov_13.058771_3_plen_57_part_00
MQPPGTKVGQVGTKLLQTWYQKIHHMVPGPAGYVHWCARTPQALTVALGANDPQRT